MSARPGLSRLTRLSPRLLSRVGISDGRELRSGRRVSLAALSGWSAWLMVLCSFSTELAAEDTPAEPPTAKSSQTAPAELLGWPLIFSEDFEDGLDRWEVLDPEGWRLETQGNGNHVWHQFNAESSYQPKVRSPFHQALIKDLEVTSFALDARVKSTHADYDHRDAVLIFSRRSPTQFYYVHFGKKTDDHAHQIFIVNEQPRLKISHWTTAGTPWTDDWHHVRVVRRMSADSTTGGSIEVFFDDMSEPIMKAEDRTFPSGRLGIGSFDDTTAWDDVRVYGERAR